MFYEAQLLFLRNLLKKQHVQTIIIDPSNPPKEPLDLGLRKLLHCESEYETIFSTTVHSISPRTIYRLCDQYYCNYLFFLLPDTPNTCALCIGPYLSGSVSLEILNRHPDSAHLPPEQSKAFIDFFCNIPTFSSQNMILAPVYTLCETIWGDQFELRDINHTLSGSTLSASSIDEGRRAQIMETIKHRYDWENQMMHAISHGLLGNAEILLGSISELHLENRNPDQIRNFKNYCIILNTLMRKAAEQGGVHPYYLNDASSSLARRIESYTSMTQLMTLPQNMIQIYCQLVQSHSFRNYSPLIQSALLYMDSNLSSDLSLTLLASTLNVNASYLSSLFKKETGQTITDYLTKKRLQVAVRLLKSTNLQIQTIAQNCGIPDVNYFSKLFKRYFQMPPKAFRNEVLSKTAQHNFPY